MRVKKNSDNQLILPPVILSRFDDVDTFLATTDGETIILRPFREERAGMIRDRLRETGIDREHLASAISWARTNP